MRHLTGRGALARIRERSILKKKFSQKGIIMRRINRILVSSTLIATVMPIGNWVAAQDLVPVSDISGSSSVFVFRNSSKAAPQRFVSKQRSRGSKEG